MKRLIALLILSLLTFPLFAGKTVHVRGYVRKDGTYVAPHYRNAPNSSSTPKASSSHHATSSTSSSSGSSSSQYTWSGQERDSKGRFKRSSNAKHQFMKETGYPHGRPGYVVDHVVALCKGGRDAPSNMQWQTIAEAKAKDGTECRR